MPRGALAGAERAESRLWRDTFAFAGRVFEGEGHAVGLAAAGDAADQSSLAIGPAGRHLGVFSVASLDAACRALAPIARFVVVVGSDDGDAARTVAPPQARVVPLGAMQSPPLDGPVDLRDH